ncbi:hypothetical protein DPMN_005931 [Dreissena polymorpha]|uniref:Uncharacterized protein n=1 Tax=Dreissena polymorpha TaxID=45954 RepID=A0A9D4RXA4_DREPO|nr:hypothetical protein DPMN_005931 [Dreissena polymorpha]
MRLCHELTEQFIKKANASELPDGEPEHDVPKNLGIKPVNALINDPFGYSSGASLPLVVSDYEERLTNAIRQAREALASALGLVLINGSVSSTNALKQSVDQECPRSLLLLNELKLKGEYLKIVAANPAEHARTLYAYALLRVM